MILLLLCYSDGRVKDNGLDMVPQEFADVLRIALSKLCELPGINPNIVNHDFWSRWPQKFRSVAGYEQTKAKKVAAKKTGNQKSSAAKRKPITVADLLQSTSGTKKQTEKVFFMLIFCCLFFFYLFIKCYLFFLSGLLDKSMKFKYMNSVK